MKPQETQFTAPERRGTCVWKCKQQQRSPTKGVNCPDGGPSKDKVDKTESERCYECVVSGGAGFLEDGRRVEGNNVDATHLLGDHDNKRGQGGSSQAGDGEEFDNSPNIGGTVYDLPLNFELSMDIVEVPSCLDRVMAKAEQRLHCFWVAVLLHVPAGRLGAEEDKNHQGDSWDERASKLQPPRDGACSADDEIRTGPETDAECSP
jgi:hypothetical protein